MGSSSGNLFINREYPVRGWETLRAGARKNDGGDLLKAQTLTEESLYRAAKTLARRDKDLAAIFKSHGPPPLWARPAGFSTLVKIILEQQVSLASAASLFARLKRNTTPFHPARMIESGEALRLQMCFSQLNHARWVKESSVPF